MPFIKKDDYTLAQSNNKPLIGGHDVRIDLTLKRNNHLNEGMVFGSVTDQLGNALPNAVVVIMDDQCNPVMHTLTGQDGAFFLLNIKPDIEYTIYASAPGFGLATHEPFKLLPHQEIEKNFSLKYHAASFLSCIVGTVKNEDGHPIENAIVKLFEQNKSTEVLQAFSLTNTSGQYVIADLPMGTYLLRINASGYQSRYETIHIANQGKILNLSFTLHSELAKENGVISGLIKDENDMPIGDATVILYRLDKDGNHIPISNTKTLTNGVYLFVNLPAGDYIIKSNKTFKIDDKIKP